MVMAFKPETNTQPILQQIVQASVQPPTQVIKSHLKKFMDERGVNTTTLAKEIGITENTVRVYSLNRFCRIDCDIAVKLCTYFGVQFGEMFRIVTVNVR